MRPDLVIFDCDGVLVDTERATNTAIADNLNRYGLQISPDECLTLFVGGTMQSAMGEARNRGADLPDDWLDEIYTEVFAVLAEGVAVINGIPALLNRLSAHGIPDCIASNGPPEKMRVSLGPSGLWDRFQGRIWSPHSHGPAKPDPALLMMAARHFGVSPDRCVMIDDNPSGVVAAQRAGMRAIGFDESGNPARLGDLGAEVVTEITELHDLLGL